MSGISWNLKNGKATGIDGIRNEYISSSVSLLMPIYIYLFNKILDEGTIPEEWLIGIIMPIYKKKGCPREPGNYRGITLLSFMGKLFTSIIDKRLSTLICRK